MTKTIRHVKSIIHSIMLYMYIIGAAFYSPEKETAITMYDFVLIDEV